MASYDDFLQCNASPHSSIGAGESPRGTPDTKITAFSPEEGRSTKPSSGKAASSPLKAGQHDPFVTTSLKPKPEVKLSATASAFQPYGSLRTAAVVDLANSKFQLGLPGVIERLESDIRAANESESFGTFSTDSNCTRCVRIRSVDGTDLIPVVRTTLYTKFDEEDWKIEGSERTESVGDNMIYIRFSNIRDAVHYFTAIKVGTKKLSVEYIPIADFTNIFSPGAPNTKFEGQIQIMVTYPTDRPFDSRQFEQSLRSILTQEGQLSAWEKLESTPGILLMRVEFRDSDIAARVLSKWNQKIVGRDPNSAMALLTQYQSDTLKGESKKFQATGTPTRSSGVYLDVNDAFGPTSLGNDAASTLNARSFGHTAIPETTLWPSESVYMTNRAFTPIAPIQMEVPVNGPVYPQNPMYPQMPQLSFSEPHYGASRVLRRNDYPALYPQFHDLVNQSGRHMDKFGSQMTTPSFATSSFEHGHDYLAGHFLSPRSLRSGSYGESIHHFSYSPATSVHDTSLQLNNYYSGGKYKASPNHSSVRNNAYHNSHNNHVDIGQIQEGKDVRTTVMLRNIPNKLDQATLKSIIDESSLGKYDFMYLRIDFSNNCNVGYAFINFMDPLDIVDFVLARSNQKWNAYKSDKIAEVSYATIQGRDCLIQKFRNSSVMLEPPHYRPKLFFTRQDPFGRAGQEDVFPPSDNASKLKRSCENAEHMGLFAPHAGQHVRDEQRRRRSQFDRGTTHAQREQFHHDYYGHGGYSSARRANTPNNYLGY